MTMFAGFQLSLQLKYGRMSSLSNRLHLIIIVLLSTMLMSCTKTVTEKYPDGTIKSEVSMRGGLKNGEARYYYPNGKIEVRMQYADDQLNGLYEEFDVNGKKTEITTFADGLKNGSQKTFYENGQVQMQANFENDKLHGAYAEFYPNGQPRVSGQYKLGLFDGTWNYYESNGILVGTGKFINGTGQQTAYFYGSKKTRAVVHYVNNEKDGEEITYSQDGNIEKKIVYKKGRIVSTPKNTSTP
jgi:antitoxin component YwqK of YwqJK toxin-antitoxin module